MNLGYTSQSITGILWALLCLNSHSIRLELLQNVNDPASVVFTCLSVSPFLKRA